MKVHEYQAKEILARHNVPVPRGGVAATPAEAGEIARTLGGHAVIKAQVHAGGRGKGGGIVLVNSAKEAEQATESLLGRRLVTPQTGPQGVPVGRVLVEETVQASPGALSGGDRRPDCPSACDDRQRVWRSGDRGGGGHPAGVDIQRAHRLSRGLSTIPGTQTLPPPELAAESN